ncbi:MAG TPA: hypothetical protein VFA46_20485 [Actinomycetes bacterium]|nr:hypothetical protein [Actinomycetes bacterium]
MAGPAPGPSSTRIIFSVVQAIAPVPARIAGGIPAPHFHAEVGVSRYFDAGTGVEHLDFTGPVRKRDPMRYRYWW